MAVDATPTHPTLTSPTFLTFHKLSRGHLGDLTSFRPARFERLLASLIKQGFSLSSDIEPSTLSAGKRLIISFDDGYAHLAKHLPALIQKFAFRPIIFMPTLYIGRSNRWDYSHIFHPEQHLSASQIKTLAGEGVIFGSHGQTHTSLTSLSDRKLKTELTLSRDILQNLIGQPVETISYPFGRVNNSVIRAAREAGYTQGFTMAFPASDDPPMAAGRIAVYRFDHLASLKRKLGRGRGYKIERAKAALINSLSGGTVMLNRLRSLKPPDESG